MKILTDKQVQNMLHALGIEGYYRFNKRWKAKTIFNKCYRNSYVTYSECESWQDLVKKGFASVFKQRQWDNSYHYMYGVTLKGAEQLKHEGHI